MGITNFFPTKPSFLTLLKDIELFPLMSNSKNLGIQEKGGEGEEVSSNVIPCNINY